MTTREATRYVTEALTAAGVPDPHADAALLLSHVTGLPRLELSLAPSNILTREQEQRLSSLLFSRASREPLQYLLGEQCFFGLDFLVDSRALIPRPETEILCEIALHFLKARTTPAPQVLDLCTGSGAIAITLKHECPSSDVTATDLSPEALSLAQENAARLGASVQFLQGDLFAPIGNKRYDLIASNPPYIESETCKTLQPEVLREPPMALDGGVDGLTFYRAIARQAANHLLPGGLLCMEIGDTQGQAVCALLQAENTYTLPIIHQDLQGKDRVVCAHAASFPT